MVQAIMDGRKTQTRRIVKPAKNATCFDIAMNKDGSNKWPRNLDADERFISDMKCPYGSIGDVLWVRETWNKVSFPDGTTARKLEFVYKADKGSGLLTAKWKPSIFMPKGACRIRLEITNIRVERLQDISESDCVIEGIQGDYPYLISNYFSLWSKINGKESLDLNPWVWVISFKSLVKY